MLAKSVDELPSGDGWIFEPKWDGFRTLIFRDGDDLFIQSRDEKTLDRYFPELVERSCANNVSSTARSSSPDRTASSSSHSRCDSPRPHGA